MKPIKNVLLEFWYRNLTNYSEYNNGVVHQDYKTWEMLQKTLKIIWENYKQISTQKKKHICSKTLSEKLKSRWLKVGSFDLQNYIEKLIKWIQAFSSFWFILDFSFSCYNSLLLLLWGSFMIWRMLLV